MSGETTPEPALEQIAEQWRAEQHHDQAAAAKKVEAMNAPAAPAPNAAPGAPGALAVVAPPPPELVTLCGGLWKFIDGQITNLGSAYLGPQAGAALAITEQENAQLATPTAAVLNKYIEKYLPGLLANVNTPEGALIAAVVTVYGMKVAALAMGAATAAPPSSTPEASPSPSPQASA